MTLQDLLNIMDISISRDDLQSVYKSSINRAVRYICDRKSFTGMMRQDQCVVPTGQQQAKLFDDFKELQGGVSPIGCVTTDQGNQAPRIIPCKILTPNEIERMGAWTGMNYYVPYSSQWCGWSNPPIWLQRDGSNWFINVPAISQQDIAFQVRYYGYPPDLEETTDDNFVTRDFSDAVLAKAKEYCFQYINDDAWADASTQFEKHFKDACRTDNYRQFKMAERRM